MGLHRLNTKEMRSATGLWLDPKSGARKAFLATPSLAPHMKRIERVHNELVAAMRPAAADARVAKISAQQLEHDARHDDLVRGIYYLLTGASLLHAEGDEGTDFAALRDLLIPDGINTVNQTYQAEAGGVDALAEKVTPEIRATIDGISFGAKGSKRTLGRFVDELVTEGRKLGQLENQKRQIAATPVEGTQAGALAAARNNWLRVVNHVVETAAVAVVDGELDKKTDAMIFGPLRGLEEVSNKRARVATKPADEPEADEAGADEAEAEAGEEAPPSDSVPPPARPATAAATPIKAKAKTKVA